MIGTLQPDQDGVLLAIKQLYLPDGPEVDVTYSQGGLYQSGIWPRPVWRGDLLPSDFGVHRADCRALPLNPGAVNSLCWDPPFVVACGEKSVIGGRFGSLKTIPELHRFYRDSITEFARVLKPNGILVVKIGDTVSGGKQHRNSFVVWQSAIHCGFIDEDIFVCPNVSKLKGHNWDKQVHARKTFVQWMIFRKR